MTNENTPPDRIADETNEKPDEMPDGMPGELSGTVLDEQNALTLTEISQACAVQTEYIIELVEEGLITPAVSPEASPGMSPQTSPQIRPDERPQSSPEAHEPYSWRFTGVHMRHVRIASHLQSDLGVNLAGVGLALQLLDEVEALRTRLKAIGALG